MPTEQQERFIKSHGRRAADVMSRSLITVAPDASLAAVAGLLEEKRIKRVPVVADGRLVGIISRANLLRGLAAAAPAAPTEASDDETLRAAVERAIAGVAGVSTSYVNVVVQDGTVELWGSVASDTEARALTVAAETVPGVTAVENRLGRVQSWAYGY